MTAEPLLSVGDEVLCQPALPHVGIYGQFADQLGVVTAVHDYTAEAEVDTLLGAGLPGVLYSVKVPALVPMPFLRTELHPVRRMEPVRPMQAVAVAGDVL